MRLLALAIAFLAAATAGCGGSSSAASRPTIAPDGALVVRMGNLEFMPKDVTVRVGQTVRWENDDNVAHNVKADSGARFASRDFGRGGTYQFTPRRAGTIAYECDLHPGMTGTLKVVR